MSIVVTGASGQLGPLVVESLLERGVDPAEIVATGRAVEKLGALADRGVRTERLDFDDVPDTVPWLGEGDVLLLVSGSEVGKRVPQHQAVVDLAVRSGVRRIAYTSAPAADDTTLAIAPEHAATEQLIRASGLPFTFLRNGWYTENYQQAFEQARETGVVTSSAGDGRVASAPRADFAAAAAAVLATEGHEGAVYELFGDVAWSFDELAAAFAEVLGRDVTYQRLMPDEHRALLVSFGLDEGTAGFVVALDQAIADGLLGLTPGDLSRLTGRPTEPLLETVRSWV
ncbi:MULTISPECIES: SDR family oxidoreductase [unclassified Nocardioides]|uniref:SDR family oxidoreductase n=1 Tax=unclassified Nocardioides TaxID=2615069 RepID=UPI0009F09F8D|nr:MULTISPECIES: SDR family oxidoreductase [unclassified Nocardioides]GAW48763.1 NmrA family protein [Nocardioides sp. PD653-B2]GAW54400.1 NmrA family protein [Nocardioides sp. PD653]